MHTTNLTVINT